MRKLTRTCNRLALAAALLLASSGAALANSIAVPDGTGGGQCANGNPNTIRFAGNCGSLVTIGSGDTAATFVQDNSANAESAFNVRFYLNMRGLTTGANALGGPMEVFAAYDGADPTPPTVAGNAALRVIVQTGGNPHQIVVEARLDGGTYASTAPVNLPRGWRSVEIHWTKGAGTGAVSWWLDGNAQAGLASLANNTEVINYARWGALVVPGGTVGTFKLDDYASQRSGNIGPALPFSDVPTSGAGSSYWPFVQTMYAADAMPECAIGSFCPLGSVTRKEMAKILLLGRYGSNFTPPVCAVPTFADVPCAHPYADWINELAAQGITGGCGGGNFCPDGIIARKDMIVFLYAARAIFYTNPGGCPGNSVANAFTGDVPDAASYCPYVNRAATDGLTAGCGGANFCPLTTLARRDIAVFERQSFSSLNPELQLHIVGP